MRRRRRTPFIKTTRRQLASTTSSALADIERDFKKATRLLALLMALLFMAKQTGGLSFPLTVVLDIQEEAHVMSDVGEGPNVLSGQALVPPSSVRLTEKLKAAVAARARQQRLAASDVIRRALEDQLCGAPTNEPVISVPDPAVQAALDALRLQVAGLKSDLALTCELIRDLRAELAHDMTGQNQALNLIAQALLDLLEVMDPDGAPANREKARAFLQKHLRLRERDE